MNRIYNYFDNNDQLVHTKLINSPNKKSLEINPESLVIKKKTQALAKQQRENTSMEELKDVLKSPFAYMNKLLEQTLTPAQLKLRNGKRKRRRR